MTKLERAKIDEIEEDLNALNYLLQDITKIDGDAVTQVLVEHNKLEKLQDRVEYLIEQIDLFKEG
jgi:conjugal transfer/entry exclusion protein